mmetsp:Transcript_62734/g.187029  ORF Transcript_62734/g.187029 Transcript_62734/m.187029 type:complete len:242 (-) Transcript_62734:83-808(-)
MRRRRARCARAPERTAPRRRRPARGALAETKSSSRRSSCGPRPRPPHRSQRRGRRRSCRPARRPMPSERWLRSFRVTGPCAPLPRHRGGRAGVRSRRRRPRLPAARSPAVLPTTRSPSKSTRGPPGRSRRRGSSRRSSWASRPPTPRRCGGPGRRRRSRTSRARRCPGEVPRRMAFPASWRPAASTTPPACSLGRTRPRAAPWSRPMSAAQALCPSTASHGRRPPPCEQSPGGSWRGADAG